MAEVDIDITREFPKPWTDEIVQAADVVVTMGCGDACPFFPGKRYENWELPDPAGQSVDGVRPIRDDIKFAPGAAGGHVASAAKEGLVNFLLMSLAPVMIAASIILIVGVLR